MPEKELESDAEINWVLLRCKGCIITLRGSTIDKWFACCFELTPFLLVSTIAMCGVLIGKRVRKEIA